MSNNNCNSSGGHGGHHGNQGGQNSQSTTASPKAMTSNKFKGNCADLNGHIFDCSDYKQADTYVHTHKCITEYIGAEETFVLLLSEVRRLPFLFLLVLPFHRDIQ